MISIEQVSDKAGLKAFISLPSHLYADDPHWVQPLHVERIEHLSAKNPASDHIHWQAWIARRGGEVVGRITAQVDSLHRDLHGMDTGHFGMLDAIDDEAVFSLLTHTAETWLRKQGAHRITGPFGLNINQESGLLVDGFDTPPSALMEHGKPYYAARLEQQGYAKGMDLLAYWMRRTDLSFTPALTSLMGSMRNRIKIRQLDRKRFAQEMHSGDPLFSPKEAVERALSQKHKRRPHQHHDGKACESLRVERVVGTDAGEGVCVRLD